jgi:hypothetical protein
MRINRRFGSAYAAISNPRLVAALEKVDSEPAKGDIRLQEPRREGSEARRHLQEDGHVPLRRRNGGRLHRSLIGS